VFEAREEAYRLYRERGDRTGAARIALWLYWDYRAFRGAAAVSNGWLRRAERVDGQRPDRARQTARPRPDGSAATRTRASTPALRAAGACVAGLERPCRRAVEAADLLGNARGRHRIGLQPAQRTRREHPEVIFAPVGLAIARSAITSLRDLADRKTPLGSMKTMRHRSAVQFALADAEAQLRAARLLFDETVRATCRRALANETATLEQRADLMLAAAHALRTSARVAELMHRMAGASGIYQHSPLERLFRDAQTVRHHGFLSESRLETVGQVYLGLEPEFGFVAF
jgi:hypothetical protein